MPVNKRNGNAWGKSLAAILGVVATIWIIVAAMGASATREWEAYAASLRAKGQPITFEEIEGQRAKIPDSANSARIVEALAGKIHAGNPSGPTLETFLFSGSNDVGNFFDGIHRGRIARSRIFLESYGEVLKELEEIRDRPSGRYTIEYVRENPIATLVPQASTVRTASKLLHLDTLNRLASGNRQGAVDHFVLQCRLAGSLGDEPMVISRLVQIAVQAVAIQTAESLLRTGELTPEQLGLLSQEIGSFRDSTTMRWALLGERAFFVESCEAVSSGRISLLALSNAAGSQFNGYPGLPAFLVRSNQLRGSQMHTALIDALDQPTAVLAAARKIDGEVPNLPPTQIITKIMLPSLTRSIVLHMRLIAQADSTLAALAAERFRMAEGRLPSTLDELVPAYLPSVPVDPFDGKPLRLAKTDEGIVIYSVNEDELDDGGDVSWRRTGRDRRPKDVGFRLNAPAYRGVKLIDDPPADED